MRIPKFGDLGFGVVPNKPIHDGTTQIKSDVPKSNGRSSPPSTVLKDWVNPWSDTDTWQGSAI